MKYVLILFLLATSLSAYECNYWYASMGVGANNRNEGILGNGSKTFLTGPVYDAALGYTFNPHFRAEVAFTFRNHPLGTITDSLAGDPLTAEDSSFSLLLNGYFSADPIGCLTPYAGWGIGYGDVIFSIHTNLSPAPSFKHTKHHSKAFAYQFTGGLSYWLNPHLDLAVEYRFSANTHLEYFFRKSHYQTHEGLIKLLYAFRERNLPSYCFAPVYSELCNNWYLTTKMGVLFREKEKYATGIKSFHPGVCFAAALGFYPFCNLGRAELEFGVKQNEVKRVLVSGFRGSGDEIILSAMLNGYLSPFNLCGFIPYAGAGLGYAYNNYAVHINLPPNLPNPPNQPTFPTFKHPRQNSHNFAYQFMGGVNYQLTCHTQLGLEYQYFRIDDMLYKSFFGLTSHEDAAWHSTTLRLTYVFKRIDGSQKSSTKRGL